MPPASLPSICEDHWQPCDRRLQSVHRHAQGQDTPEAAPVSRRQPPRSTRDGKVLAYAEEASSNSDGSDASSSGGEHHGAVAESAAEQKQADDDASEGLDIPCSWLLNRRLVTLQCNQVGCLMLVSCLCR